MNYSINSVLDLYLKFHKSHEIIEFTNGSKSNDLKSLEFSDLKSLDLPHGSKSNDLKSLDLPHGSKFNDLKSLDLLHGSKFNDFKSFSIIFFRVKHCMLRPRQSIFQYFLA